jgi:hypothetical protein
MVPLSESTRWRLEGLFFGAPDRAAAAELLVERCAENLRFPGDGSPEGLERVRFAALKVSRGDLGRLRGAVELGERDWRDLLLVAGFANDIAAHLDWWPEGSSRPG